MLVLCNGRGLKGLVLAVALGVAAPLAAEAQEGAWVRSPTTHCHVWNSSGQPNRTFTWSGDCQNGIARGRGVLQWFTNGIPSGRYIGEYSDGRMNGRGVFEYANGDVYEGEFRDDRPNGRASFRAANGSRYSGLVRNGSPVQGEAQGTTAGDGLKNYRGVFSDGQPVRGKVKFPDGSTYDGELRDAKPSGWGVFTTAGGGRYEGEFANGKPNGFGTYEASVGVAYAGLWTDGCFRQRNRTAAVIATEKECSTRSAS